MSGERFGLVLGGGGVLGGAWMVGALSALERRHGLDARRAELLIGTSAGSVVASLLAAGVAVEHLRAHQLGDTAQAGPLAGVAWNDRSVGSATPPRPRFGPGSAGLVAHNVTRLRHLPPTAVLAALVPEGRGSLGEVGRLVEAAVPRGWASHPGLRVVAMDYGSGRRTVFGAPGAPQAPLPQAVMASCAIPGWYAPVTIAGQRYVDGGACSATNADLAAGLGLDHVYVLAPMVSFVTDHPSDLLARVERRWRVRVTRRCLHEVARVHAGGSEVTVLGPGPEDLAAIGANVMDAARRRAVLTIAERTSLAALEDPAPLASGPAAGTGPLPPAPRRADPADWGRAG